MDQTNLVNPLRNPCGFLLSGEDCNSKSISATKAGKALQYLETIHVALDATIEGFVDHVGIFAAQAEKFKKYAD